MNHIKNHGLIKGYFCVSAIIAKPKFKLLLCFCFLPNTVCHHSFWSKICGNIWTKQGDVPGKIWIWVKPWKTSRAIRSTTNGICSKMNNLARLFGDQLAPSRSYFLYRRESLRLAGHSRRGSKCSGQRHRPRKWGRAALVPVRPWPAGSVEHSAVVNFA